MPLPRENGITEGCKRADKGETTRFPHPMAHLHLVTRCLAIASLIPVLLPEVLAQGSGGVYNNVGEVVSSARPESDPGDLYLSAYRLCRESELLAEKQSIRAALRKGMEAERLLATLVRDHPNWKTNLVGTRRRLLAENMANYRRALKEEGEKGSTPPGEKKESPRRTHEDLQAEVQTELPSAPLLREAGVQYYNEGERKLYQALQRAQEECRRMAEAYRDLNARFVETQKKLAVAQMEQNTYKEHYEKLRQQVTTERAAGNSVVDSLSRQLAEAESKYRHAQKSLESERTHAEELERRLAETQQTLERVTHERDNLARENEQLRAVVELNSPEKTKALLDQNLTLAEQLKTAKEKIAELEAAQTGSSDENEVLAHQLDEARAEAARLRDELNSIYDENMGYRRRVSELTAQLNNLEADLEERESRPVVDPALQEENKLLRDIIDKQKKALAMQQESRRLLIETYGKLKNSDPAVMQMLEKLKEEGMPGLTESEQEALESVRRHFSEKKPESDDAARLELEVHTLADLANQAFAKGRYLSAEQMYLTLYDLQPDQVAGLVNLGTILLYNNKSAEALNYLKRAIRLASDMAVGYYLAGIAYYREEQLGEAQKMFSRTVQLDPGNAEAFFYLANIEGIGGSHDRALKHYAAAVKINPSLADAHYNMARLYAEDGRLADAARAYDRAVHNGAMPDTEFEQFLRHHTDATQKLGTDLVATVKPEDEAKELGFDEQKSSRIASKNATNKNEETTENQDAERVSAEQEKLNDFLVQVERVSQPVKGVQSPSPAGIGHETQQDRFANIRMKTHLGLRPLRLKRPEPQRLRERGEEEIELVRRSGRRR